MKDNFAMGPLKQAAPFDARFMLALICLPVAWKILSLDFSSLELLCERAPLFRFKPNFLFQWLSSESCTIFSLASPLAMQLSIAILLIALVIRPSRVLLISAIVLLWILDTSAYMFRGTLYTLDTPLALLVVISILPVKLKEAFSTSLQPAVASRIVMIACLMYVATYYVLAGLAKFDFSWYWPSIVKIGNYYPISFIWHSQELPPMIDNIARRTSELFLAYPSLDIASALLVLVEQFLWLAAPFALIYRFHAGVFSCAYHILTALMTGIVFITWIFIPIAVTFPFSAVARRLRNIHLARPRDVPKVKPQILWPIIIFPIVLASLSSGGWPFPPFHNYYQFGWKYDNYEDISVVYRVGYQDPEQHEIRVFPLNQGGFLDFRQTALLDANARRALENKRDGKDDEVIGKNISTLLLGTAGIGANGHLLGRFRAPEHLLGMPGSTDMRSIKKFFLLKGKPQSRVGSEPVAVDWRICGEIFTETDSFTRFEECGDG